MTMFELNGAAKIVGKGCRGLLELGLLEEEPTSKDLRIELAGLLVRLALLFTLCSCAKSLNPRNSLSFLVGKYVRWKTSQKLLFYHFCPFDRNLVCTLVDIHEWRRHFSLEDSDVSCDRCQSEAARAHLENETTVVQSLRDMVVYDGAVSRCCFHEAIWPK